MTVSFISRGGELNKVGYIYHDLYLKHRAPAYHPERPERLIAINTAIEEARLFDDLVRITPKPAEKEDILKVHSEEYYKRVEATKGKQGHLDPDTYYNEHSFDAALMAVGGVLTAGKKVFAKDIDRAFCAVRPPGHHVDRDNSKGFCLFNNIAVLARYLIDEYKFERVAILDWDGHHGNGTQNIFYSDPMVHYTSLHRYPFYPGTGSASDMGYADGVGYNLNFPLSAGAGDREFNDIISQTWTEAMNNFKPQIILLSAGFDAYEKDPLVGLGVTLSGFEKAGRRVCRVADDMCGGRLISVLEGGYVLNFINQAVIDHLKILME